MTTSGFLDRLMHDASAYLTGKKDAAFGRYIEDHIPCLDPDSLLYRKEAAIAVYGMLREVMEIGDIEWGDAALLKDIYECKVCANAIAQVCARGIVIPKSKTIFGLDDILSDREAEQVIMRLSDLVGKR